jgi:hypothetical protein
VRNQTRRTAFAGGFFFGPAAHGGAGAPWPRLQNSRRNLTAGAYSMDATQEHLDLLTEEALPLAKIADWSCQGPRHNAVILLLAWNSD